MDNLCSIIFDIVSFVAALITVVSAIISRKTLSELECFKKSLYRKEYCNIAIDKLKKIKTSINNEVKAEGATTKNVKETCELVESLVKDNTHLRDECNVFIRQIRTTVIVNTENKEMFVGAIEAIIKLYKKGENNGL